MANAYGFEKLGYFTSEETAFKLSLLLKAGLRGGKNIPAAILTGEPGAGKTYAAEAVAKLIERETGERCKTLFVQCYEDMDSNNFIASMNISAVLRRDSQNAVDDGILVKALKSTTDGPTLVVIDEIDKATPAVDTLLLDFLNSGRVTNGREEWRKGDGKIWVILTSNGQRELSDALKNRCRQITVERPTGEQFARLAGIPESHHAVNLYEDAGLSIRQMLEYLSDIDYMDLFCEEAFSQYVNLDHEEYGPFGDDFYFGFILDDGAEQYSCVRDIIRKYKKGFTNNDGEIKVFEFSALKEILKVWTLNEGRREGFFKYGETQKLVISKSSIEELVEMTKGCLVKIRGHEEWLLGWMEHDSVVVPVDKPFVDALIDPSRKEENNEEDR